HNVGFGDGLVEGGEGDVVEAFEALGKLTDIRLHGVERDALKFFGQVDGDVEGGGLTQVINVGLESQAQERNGLGLGGGDSFLDLSLDPCGLAVVDVACGVDKLRVLRISGDDKPRIDSDAVTAHARTRLHDIRARVVVSQLNTLPHIDSQLVGDEGELVRESDVDIAESVLRQLGHLRSDIISGQKLPVTERSVNLRGAAGCLRSLATYDAVISAQLLHCVTGEDALRAVS